MKNTRHDRQVTASDPVPLGRKEDLVFIACTCTYFITKTVRMSHKPPTWQLPVLKNQPLELRNAVPL